MPVLLRQLDVGVTSYDPLYTGHDTMQKILYLFNVLAGILH